MQLDLATSKDIAEVMAEIRAVRQRLDELAPPPEWVSVAEYMDRKGVSKSTVYQQIDPQVFTAGDQICDPMRNLAYPWPVSRTKAKTATCRVARGMRAG